MVAPLREGVGGGCPIEGGCGRWLPGVGVGCPIEGGCGRWLPGPLREGALDGCLLSCVKEASCLVAYIQLLSCFWNS